MSARNWGLLLLLSLLWGSSFFFYKVLVAVLPPVTAVLGRVGIAAIALNLWLLARGDALPLRGGLWARFLLLGLLKQRHSLCADRLGRDLHHQRVWHRSSMPPRRSSWWWWRIF